MESLVESAATLEGYFGQSALQVAFHTGCAHAHTQHIHINIHINTLTQHTCTYMLTHIHLCMHNAYICTHTNTILT